MLGRLVTRKKCRGSFSTRDYHLHIVLNLSSTSSESEDSAISEFDPDEMENEPVTTPKKSAVKKVRDLLIVTHWIVS